MRVNGVEVLTVLFRQFFVSGDRGLGRIAMYADNSWLDGEQRRGGAASKGKMLSPRQGTTMFP
jgi:hypothetical protein